MRLTKGVLFGVLGLVALGGAAFAAREKVSVDRFAQFDKDMGSGIANMVGDGDYKAAARMVAELPAGSCIHASCSRQVSAVLARIDISFDADTARLVSRSLVLSEKQRLRAAGIIARAEHFRELREHDPGLTVAKLEEK